MGSTPIRGSMNIKELKEKIKDLPDEMPVRVWVNDEVCNGWDDITLIEVTKDCMADSVNFLGIRCDV